MLPPPKKKRQTPTLAEELAVLDRREVLRTWDLIAETAGWDIDAEIARFDAMDAAAAAKFDRERAERIARERAASLALIHRAYQQAAAHTRVASASAPVSVSSLLPVSASAATIAPSLYAPIPGAASLAKQLKYYYRADDATSQALSQAHARTQAQARSRVATFAASLAPEPVTGSKVFPRYANMVLIPIRPGSRPHFSIDISDRKIPRRLVDDPLIRHTPNYRLDFMLDEPLSIWSTVAFMCQSGFHQRSYYFVRQRPGTDEFVESSSAAATHIYYLAREAKYRILTAKSPVRASSLMRVMTESVSSDEDAAVYFWLVQVLDTKRPIRCNVDVLGFREGNVPVA